jgi:DnaK suppressor protein
MKAGSSPKRISPTPSAAKSVTAKRKVKTSSQGKKYAAIRRDLVRQRKVMLEEAVEGLANPNGQEAFPDVSDQSSARMDQDIYGICERCEEEIPYPRLKARPVTTLCIDCKTIEEQEEKIRR